MTSFILPGGAGGPVWLPGACHILEPFVGGSWAFWLWGTPLMTHCHILGPIGADAACKGRLCLVPSPLALSCRELGCPLGSAPAGWWCRISGGFRGFITSHQGSGDPSTEPGCGPGLTPESWRSPLEPDPTSRSHVRLPGSMEKCSAAEELCAAGSWCFLSLGNLIY